MEQQLFCIEDDIETMLSNLVEEVTTSDNNHTFSIFITNFFDSPTELERLIQHYQPDIICFQNLTYDSLQTILNLPITKNNYYFDNISAELATEIVCSKYPIVVKESFPFHISSCNSYVHVTDIAFPVNQFQPDGDSITIVNAVLDHSESMRQNQFSELLKMFSDNNQDNVFITIGTCSLDTKFEIESWSEINSHSESNHKALYTNSRYYYANMSDEDSNGEWLFCKFIK